MITAIVPVRLSTDRLYDEIERIDRIARTVPQDQYGLLIVDYGTCEARRHELSDLAALYHHIELFRVDTTETFSIGRARDIGVQRARTPVIMFHDVDFICTAATYRRIYERATARNLEKTAYDFFCVPTLYLTSAGTEVYLQASGAPHGAVADNTAHDWFAHGRTKYYEHCAMGSSALVINRHCYLALGGHDPSFVGHGAEDFELFHRLAVAAPPAPRPERYYDNIRDVTSNYKGYRAYFALFGLDVWMAGICMVHLDHPRREAIDESYRRSSENFKLLRARMMEFDKTNRGLPSLVDPYVDEKTLLLMSPTSMPARALRFAMPLLGTYEFIREEDFKTADSLIEFVRERAFTQILFLNPYGNAHRLQHYKACRNKGLRTIAFDRGALPDSWFFDRDGFLATSSQYQPKTWDVDLPPDQLAQVRDWIADFRRQAETLEDNESQQGVEYWRRTLGIGERKVVLIALQRPTDTATVYFSDPVGSAETFNDWIRALAARIDRRKYVIVIKKHPLESERPDIDGVIFPRDTANINDLIKLSSVVVAINSGVGLIALIEGRPVVVCGEAFYQHEGLAHQAGCIDELVTLTQSDLTVSTTAVERLTFHLINRFYSFGAAEYATRTENDGASKKIVHRIDFRRLAQLGAVPVELGRRRPALGDQAYLLKVAGYNRPAADTGVTEGQPSVASLALSRRLALHLGALALSPVLSAEDLRRMKSNPVDFFKKAKWGPNRALGRLVLSKSQRAY